LELEEKAEELLETLWIKTDGARGAQVSVAEVGGEADPTVRQIFQYRLATLQDGELQLTDEGLSKATSVVRRHRLAERLLADVLDSPGGLLHERACRFEHVLDEGLEDAICTLLGHPRICPHGSPIPLGRCCIAGEEETQRVVAPLADLNLQQEGKIAYIHTTEARQLQKLMNMGIIPGAPIKLLQRFPSYVLQVRHTQFAVDKELADAIHVRLVAPPMPSGLAPREGKRPQHGLRHRLGWRRGRDGKDPPLPSIPTR